VGTLRGDGPRSTQFLALDGEIRWLSHAFEFYRTDPRTGFSAEFKSSLNSQQLGSSLSAQRMRLGFESLWNVQDYDPPLWVFGIRGGAALTLTDDRLGPGTALPPTFRQYLGGSADLRGFGRQELPGPAGGLSAAFASLELRWAGAWAGSLQPLVFLDIGATGSEPWHLASPLFWSPGLGLRWASPVGTVRSSLAHGLVAGAHDAAISHFQFYLSLGEEF
jgi:translocation and assembly module TamA